MCSTAYSSRVPVFTLIVGGESVLHIFLALCIVLLCVFMFWVLCCDVRYDYLIKTMFGSSLPPVVCTKAHVFFMLFVFVLCFCFVFLRLVYPMLPVSLDCRFWLPLRYSLTFIWKSVDHKGTRYAAEEYRPFEMGVYWLWTNQIYFSPKGQGIK